MKTLVLHNDTKNSFEHVIISLVDICGHEVDQAEQCAYITNYTGKCKIKTSNDIMDLLDINKRLVAEGLDVELV